MRFFEYIPLRRNAPFLCVIIILLLFILNSILSRSQRITDSEPEHAPKQDNRRPIFETPILQKQVFHEQPKPFGQEPVKKENVFDTLDGIGYHFEESKPIIMDPRFAMLNSLPPCDLSVDKPNARINTRELMDSFQKCIAPFVQKWKNNVTAINEEWEQTEVCDSVFKDVAAINMTNLHEIKWTILPTCKEENVMVTLGIGHDTMAEEKLNITLPNTKFYGADPIIEPNRQLYTAFGKYFPFAIGKKPGFTNFRVLPNQNQKTRQYEFQDVTTLPFTYFLSDILGLKKIDISWIDIEGGEFQFLDQFYRGASLDEKGITICQFNLEVHSKFHPPGAQVFHDFVYRILEDRRYVFWKPVRTEPGVHRMFFFNVEDQQCVRKFLQ